MKEELQADLVVVGAGVGGYVAAIRAAQLGSKVVLVERQPTLGGTCLNVGCIPSKALLESSELYAIVQHRLALHGIGVQGVTLDLPGVLRRKDGIVRQLTDGIRLLMKKNRITVLHGRGVLVGEGLVRVEPVAGLPDAPGSAGSGAGASEPGAAQEVRARSILLATGSAPVALPFLPFDGVQVVSSTEALSFDQVPEHLLVVGAGAVGLELGSVWRRFGARVTVAEILPRILPFADRQAASTLQRALVAQGLDIRLQTAVRAARREDGRVVVTLQREGGQSEELACDRVLVAVGRRPVTEGLGLESVGLAVDARGRLPVDERLCTARPGIYAVGDLIDGPMLAHKASHEGLAAAEIIAGRAPTHHREAIPNVVYTEPELASVGLNEEEAREQGLQVKVGRALFRANGRALTLGQPEGLVKVLADAQSDRLLGVHIVGPRASDLVAEAGLALQCGASATDLARTVHAHPTLSEALFEATLDVDRRAIHA